MTVVDLFKAMGVVVAAVLFIALIIPVGTKPSVAQQEPEPREDLPKAELRSEADVTRDS